MERRHVFDFEPKHVWECNGLCRPTRKLTAAALRKTLETRFAASGRASC